jgi:hypothetical protein
VPDPFAVLTTDESSHREFVRRRVCTNLETSSPSTWGSLLETLITAEVESNDHIIAKNSYVYGCQDIRTSSFRSVVSAPTRLNETFGAVFIAGGSLSEPPASAFERDLVALSTAFFEDYGRRLDEKSALGLRRLLHSRTMAVRTSIAAESTGLIVATWRHNTDILTLRFRDDQMADYAVSVADVAGGRKRAAATLPVLSIFDLQPLAAAFVEQASVFRFAAF